MPEEHIPEFVSSTEDKPRLTPDEEQRYQREVKEGPVENALRLQQENARREAREKREKKSQKNRSPNNSDEQTNLPL